MIRLQVLYPILIPSPSIFSPPCPSLVFFFSFFFFLSPTLWFTGLCGGCWCQHGACLEGVSPPSQTSWQISAYMSVCIFISRPRCPLTHFTHSSLLCFRHLQPSPNAAGSWWTLFQHGSHGSTALRQAKWVETVWEASAPLAPTFSKITPPPAWSNSPGGAFCETTVIISTDRSSLESSEFLMREMSQYGKN